MSTLVYCITEAGRGMVVPQFGIDNLPLQTVECDGLQCIASDVPGDRVPALSSKDSVLVFHRVLQELFAQGAIIPFRFPTLIEDEAQLGAFLHEHAAEYHDSLKRLRDMVQMEIRLSHMLKDNSSPREQRTGADYLRGKQKQETALRRAADQIRSAAETTVQEWQERGSAETKRLFALIPRSAVDLFRTKLAGVVIEPEVKARASGPWPATEFLRNDVQV